METYRVLTSCSLLLLLVLGSTAAPVEEENPEFWRYQARQTLQAVLDRKTNTNVAKNIVLFTYSVDFQIPDSAATATAYLCGVKTNLNTIGVNAAARNGICRSQKGNEVTSILKWAKDAGKAVGIVTTTRVIIGGGRKYMTPRGTRDPEYPRDYTSRGKRKDGRDLIQEWQSMKANKVAPGDMRFHAERDPRMDPSLAEATEKAIRILSKNPKGFFLLVEGGRIDQAHHAGRASMALHEAVALDQAVEKALELTNEQETLTVVTADHSQPFVFNGYPFRGNSILGKSPLWARDMLPFTTLLYGNGPGYKMNSGKRPDLRNVNTKTKDYVQLAAVPMDSATHAGEDVVILARGPMAHLLQGVHEQNYIAHAMAYAACVGADRRHCAHADLKAALLKGLCPAKRSPCC
ncbi:hypothetical protein CRUP_002499 [Coryphaenoides rupestris]|nr:hypothetical protein CRUP_002499 [Coryphaenoides rupestris]